MPIPKHDPPIVGWLDEEPEPATTITISGEPYYGFLPDATRLHQPQVFSCTRCDREPRHSGSELCARCLRNQATLDSGERQFVDGDTPEMCAACGKHISRHYGGVEYRCDPREECARCGAVGPVDVACAGCEARRRAEHPRGLHDAGARPAPRPLCTLTAWCLREPGHEGPCTPRPVDTYPPADFGPRAATRRRA